MLVMNAWEGSHSLILLKFHMLLIHDVSLYFDRLIDKWAQLQKGDDIYMLEEVAEILINILQCHQLAYPPSCTSFQQFSVSFLRT